MSVCKQGHVLDEGKDLCSRCNQPAWSEPKEVELPVEELVEAPVEEVKVGKKKKKK